MHRLSVLKYELTRQINFSLYKPGAILFDHIPKCAGRAVNHYLMKFYSPSVTFGLDGVKYAESVQEFRLLPKKEQLKYRFIYGHSANKLIDFVNSEAKILTVLRDPVERIISHYYYVKSFKMHFLHDKLIKERITLKEYCGLNLSTELENQFTQHFSRLTLDEIKQDEKASVELAFKNIIKTYDLIGFQSHIPEFYSAFSDMMGLPKRHNKNIKINSTNRKPKLEELEAKTLDEIKKYNHLDILLYEKLIAIKQHGVIKKSN